MILPNGITFHRPNFLKHIFPKSHDNTNGLISQFDLNEGPSPHTDAARQGRKPFLCGLVTTQSRVFQVLKSTSQSKDVSSEEFDQIISNATTTTIFTNLRGIRIPDALTYGQKSKILSLLKAYNPLLLKTSPIVNVDGQPVELNLDVIVATSVENIAVSLNEDQKKAIIEMFNNYPAHLESLKNSVEVKKINEADVPTHECVLVGQEGVFAKKTIEEGTLVCMFDGMLLEHPTDIENDKKLRKLAGCDNYFNRMISEKGSVLEGMGISMKLNVATSLFLDLLLPDMQRNNLDGFFLKAKNKKTGEILKFSLFKANQKISKGEQLCFFYDVNSSR